VHQQKYRVMLTFLTNMWLMLKHILTQLFVLAVTPICCIII
jgi:hypothetical protein